MTVTETAPVALPDGRTIEAGTLFRIKGERGTYRAHHLNDSGKGLWAWGGTGHGEYRCRQWRCVPLERVGTLVKGTRGSKEWA